ARNDASAECGVRFGAHAGADSEARNGQPARVEKASLIVAASVNAAERAGETVFNFIFVTGRSGTAAKGVGGLLAKSGAIELVGGGEEWRIGVGVESAIFVGAESVLPVRAGAEIPG